MNTKCGSTVWVYSPGPYVTLLRFALRFSNIFDIVELSKCVELNFFEAWKTSFFNISCKSELYLKEIFAIRNF